jgi:2,4-dienoyl-CoA reductase-like NADH-dependent reductase (Old Yellow Enzyme family)
MHAGALSQFLRAPRAPSAVKPLGQMLNGYGGEGEFSTPIEMNSSDIERATAGFASAAQRAIQAGFDGVEIHAANGYLLDQFITEYTNLREDSYGGELQRRMRFVSEVLGAIRVAVGERFVVGIRLSQGKVNDFDYRWPGGLAAGRVIFGAVQEAGADYIHFASEGKEFDHGCRTPRGESLPQLARNETHLPVIANGGLENPDAARRILEEGHGDLVALATGAFQPGLGKADCGESAAVQFRRRYAEA